MKPITTTEAEARELIALAAECGRVLQVGHLERFNPVILAVAGELVNPRFIESNRLAPPDDKAQRRPLSPTAMPSCAPAATPALVPALVPMLPTTRNSNQPDILVLLPSPPRNVSARPVQ